MGAVACVAAVVGASSCTRQPAPRPPAGGSGKTLDTVNYVAEANQAHAAGRLPWFCHSEGQGGSMEHGHENGLANDVYKGKVKGDLSWTDCSALAVMFDKIIAQVKPFKTRGDAKRAGSAQLVQHVDGLGTHDTVMSANFSTRPGLPPGPPMFLQYAGSGDDAPLAGLSYFTFTSGPPPAGFPGDNDFWHTHATLCYSQAGKVVGNEISDAECSNRKGVNIRLPGVWMSHAWIIPGWEDKYDVFAGAYMCVRANGIPPAEDDPCRTDQTDPEHGNTGGPATTAPAPVTTRPGTPTTRPGPTTTVMPGMDHGEHAH